MSEPILERLSRFTPDAGRLDRDALLFAAGRDSARPNRGWMTLASLLAGTQALSLALLVAAPEPSGREIDRLHRERASSGRGSRASGLRGDRPIPASGRPATACWSRTPNDRPAADVTFIDSEPPLRAFRPPPSLLN